MTTDEIQKLLEVADKWEGRYPTVAEMLRAEAERLERDVE